MAREYGAPKIAMRKGNPRSVLMDLLREHPRASEAEIVTLFMLRVLGNNSIAMIAMPPEAEAIFEYFSTNHARSIARYEPELAPEVYVERSEARAQAKTARKQGMAKKFQALIRGDFIMPNGKPLRECTFGYVGQIGGFFTALSSRGKPNEIIGEKLTDEQIAAT